MKIPIKNIPFCNIDTNAWSTKSFNNQKEFADFLVENCFKEPGEYFFHRSFTVDGGWVESANNFNNKGRYIDYSEDTEEYWDFWDNEELKCRLGVIWLYEDRYYYTTGDYYFTINYFRIVNKEKSYNETFPTVRDGQYHTMLYEKISEIKHMNSGELKRRQFLWSNLHVAKSINYLWFENNKRIKWLAYDESKIIGAESSWYMLDIAKKHLNLNTGWYRGFTPDKGGEIHQRIKVKDRDNWYWSGNESVITAHTAKTNDSAGVGGNTFWVWYEEGGIFPNANLNWQYMEPSITSGGIRSGSMCIGGSVGDLDQCKPLKEMINNPSAYGIYSVPTKYYDETGVVKYCGLFIPAQWCMPEAMDEHGNSLVDLALSILDKSEFIGWKSGEMKGNLLVENDEASWVSLPEEEYILKKSQQPRTIKEAFAHRKVATFNSAKCDKRQEQIKILEKDSKLFKKQGLLIRQTTGIVRLKELLEFNVDKPTEMKWPVDPQLKDKRGVVNIYEEYNPKFQYFGGVDSTEVEITTTSESLFSITIYRRSYTEIDKLTGKKRMVRGKVVATWAGRFDSSDETFEHGMMLLEMYKAKAACERNKPGFINYCRRLGRGQLIAKRNELPFDKDIDVTANENDQYGVWRDSAGKLLKELISVTKQSLNAEMDVIYLDKEDDKDEIGQIKKIIRGYDYIDDYWLLEELKYYNDEDNFDRCDSLFYALAYGTSEELSFPNASVEIESKEKKKTYNKESGNYKYFIDPNKIAKSFRKNLLKY